MAGISEQFSMLGLNPRIVSGGRAEFCTRHFLKTNAMSKAQKRNLAEVCDATDDWKRDEADKQKISL